MKLIDKIKAWAGGPFVGAQEGSYRGPFLGLGEQGNFSSLGSLEDGWQRHLHVGNGARNISMVYACVMMYARALSQCTPYHLIEKSGEESWDPSRTSPASRVLRHPNEYETWSQYVYNTVAELLFEGESLSVKVRDDRNAIIALHRVPRGNWSIHVDPESKTPFYGINDSDMYNSPDMLVPARDVVHFRQHCPRHPLIGESPIKAAAMAVGINVALTSSQLAFFSQMSRPSGVVSTDSQLTITQMQQLREAFNEQSKGWAQGKVPILANGLKWQPVNISQADSQLIEQQKLSNLDIARVFGVPMALLSESSGSNAGTEALISHWLSIGLGAIIETIERTLDKAFSHGVGERIELDPRPLLRVDFASRIEGLVKAVQGGLLTPREARKTEGYGEKDGDDQLYLQRQMTPMNLLNELNQAELQAKINPPESPAPAAPPPQPPAEAKPEAKPEEKSIDPDITRAMVFSYMEAKKRKAA